MINSIKYLFLIFVVIALGFANEIASLNWISEPVIKTLKVPIIRVIFIVFFCFLSTKTFSILTKELPKSRRKFISKLFLIFSTLLTLLTYADIINHFCFESSRFLIYQILEPLTITIFLIASILFIVFNSAYHSSTNSLKDSIRETQSMLNQLNRKINKITNE